MNQKKIGRFIAQKRHEKNLTQEQLAEKLGVTNKAVSKWETGNSMPDWSIIQPLCDILEISVSTLLTGEERENEEIVLKLLKVIEKLRQLKYVIEGLLIGALLPDVLEEVAAIFDISSGTFLNGIVIGTSIAIKVIGVCVFAYGFVRYQKLNE